MTEKKKPTTEREQLERDLLRATDPVERDRLRKELERLGSRDAAEKR